VARLVEEPAPEPNILSWAIRRARPEHKIRRHIASQLFVLNPSKAKVRQQFLKFIERLKEPLLNNGDAKMPNGELRRFRTDRTGEHPTASLTEMPRPREFGRQSNFL
jgi:hypothetical protein